MNILLGGIILLLMLPIYLGWVLLISVPIAMLDIGLVNLPRYLFKKLENSKQEFTQSLNQLVLYIRRHTNSIKSPQKVCSCYAAINGKSILFTEFSDGQNSWSHSTTGHSFSEAVEKMNYKLFSHENHPKCGLQKCKNKSCPTLKKNSMFKEVIHMDAKDLKHHQI